MEAYKEVGKQLLNIGVAVVVFVIIQPFVSNSLKISFIIEGFIAYLFITMVGFILIRKAEKMEKQNG